MQSAWTPFADRASSSTDTISSGNNNYWMMGMIQPWWCMGISPRDMADIYASGISAMTDSVAKGTRMATNILFAGIEASRPTTNYARHNSNEIARLTSILRGSLDRMQKIQLVGCKRTDIVISQREKQYRL
jgi:hypothetical protein